MGGPSTNSFQPPLAETKDSTREISCRSADIWESCRTWRRTKPGPVAARLMAAPCPWVRHQPEKEEADRGMLCRLGISEYLTKPIKQSELCDVIINAIGVSLAVSRPGQPDASFRSHGTIRFFYTSGSCDRAKLQGGSVQPLDGREWCDSNNHSHGPVLHFASGGEKRLKNTPTPYNTSEEHPEQSLAWARVSRIQPAILS